MQFYRFIFNFRYISIKIKWKAPKAVMTPNFGEFPILTLHYYFEKKNVVN